MDAAPLAAGSVDYARERERPLVPGGNRVCLGGRWKTLKNVEILNLKRNNIHWWTGAGSNNKGLSPRAIIDNREDKMSI